MPTAQTRIAFQLFFLTGALLLVGQLILFSATGILGIQRHGSEFYFVIRQFSAAIFGIAAMFAVSRLPHGALYRIAYLAMLVQIVLVIATWFGPLSRNAMGASRWLHLGPFAFQPSEFARITISVYLARFLAQREERPLTRSRLIIWGIPPLVLMGTVLLQPDLGTTLILAAIAIGMLYVSGTGTRRVLVTLGVLASAAVVLMLSEPYRRRRIIAFLDPWSDPHGIGFQTILSFLSFHSGGLLGSGIGNGNSKLFYLPEVHTDFIFSLIGEELGFLGATTILVAFVYLAFLLLQTTQLARDRFSKLLAFGLSGSLLLPITVNLLGVTGLLPLKGLPLPFFSWGRSSLVVNLIALGILMNVLRESARTPAVRRPTKTPGRR